MNSLRAFEAAARHLSFSRAADELHVTHAAVSHQIKGLEAYLGVPLFRRVTRAVHLTQAGQAYMLPVRDALDRISEATENLSAQTTRGPLTISVAPSFATRWLVPRLHEFEAAHPDIEVRLVISFHLVDFADSETIAAIRHGSGDWPGLVVHKLMTEELIPVCAPDLVTDENPLRGLDDLTKQVLLHVEPRANDWAKWLRAAGIEDPKIDHRQRFPTLVLALDAAMAGLGIAIGDRRLVANDIERGRLIAPFDLSIESDSAYYLVYPQHHGDTAKLSLFRDWLMAQM